jgi:hypothetical protein
MRLHNLIVTIAFTIFCGCTTHGFRHPLREREQQLGTAGERHWKAHTLVETPQGIGLRFPGYIVGVEKSVGASEKSWYEAQEFTWQTSQFFTACEKGSNRKILNDSHRTFVSHIARFTLASNTAVPYIATEFLHNAYEADSTKTNSLSAHVFDVDASLRENSFESLRKLKNAIGRDCMAAKKSRPISHVFVYAMGWQTPESEAIDNFNSLYGNLLEAARHHDGFSEFNPLIVGISWPSVSSEGSFPNVLGMIWHAWAGYRTKADDADEVGMIWGNLLINDVLASLKKEHKFKIVAIGHSFGARLITRAVFSGPAIANRIKLDSPVTDLVIGLEGAFATKRFASNTLGQTEGFFDPRVEGGVYRNYISDCGKAVMVWSPFDTATPQREAFGGENLIGGPAGYDKALKCTNDFDFVTWSCDSFQPPSLQRRRVVMVNAKDLIQYETYEHGGSAHSDIYHPRLGRFVVDVLAAYAPMPKN